MYSECGCSMLTFVCVDITANRLEFAKQLGADFTMTVESSADPRANANAITSLLGCQLDVTIECSGAESSLQTAVYVRLIIIVDSMFLAHKDKI